MAIFNAGSINADFFYYLTDLPRRGETLTATSFERGLGGKGANQSIAALCAGADVTHIGAVGQDGVWAIEQLSSQGLNCDHVAVLDAPTGHAIINVEASGENSIVIFPGANRELTVEQIEQGLAGAGAGDFLLLQNEINLVTEAALIGQKKGLYIAYSAAPFVVADAVSVMPHVDLMILNEVEYEQLMAATSKVSIEMLPPELLVTKGARGADLIRSEQTVHVAAFAVKPVDTTGAGDCFAGYFCAGIDSGLTSEKAMKRAAAAAAIKVTRQGTSEVVPNSEEVEDFLANQD
ncbi:MAG: ribokinase [Litoreibacter sp.]|nr:ribokinase [Litoreibacter sp.]